MKIILVSDLTVQSNAECDLYSALGELVIHKNTPITSEQIESLAEAYTTELYALEPDDTELLRLFTSPARSLQDLWRDREINDDFSSTNMTILQLPALHTIKSGRAGFDQLHSSRTMIALDRLRQSGNFADKPDGPSPDINNVILARRDDSTLRQMLSLYLGLLDDCTLVHKAILSGSRVDGKSVKQIAENIVEFFCADRNFSLCLANTKSNTDTFLFHHCLNVSIFSTAIAIQAGFSREQTIEIAMGALLHDIGMQLVPQSILTRKGSLSQDDWYEIQKHSFTGIILCSRLTAIPDSVLYIIHQNHERENGRGYPFGRTTRLIHNYAKIVQTADVYESLSSPRPYRGAHLPYKAMEMLIKMTRQGLVSGEYVKWLLYAISLYPIGSLVELSDKRIARVIHANMHSPARPVIRAITDHDRQLIETLRMETIDMQTHETVHVVKALTTTALPGVDISVGF